MKIEYKKKEGEKMSFKQGDIVSFEYDGEDCLVMICRVSKECMQVIDMVDANRCEEPIPIEDSFCITFEEFNEMIGGGRVQNVQTRETKLIVY